MGPFYGYSSLRQATLERNAWGVPGMQFDIGDWYPRCVLDL